MEIKKKELKYRGKTEQELKQLDVREFAKLLGARQKRTVLRNFQEHENFVKLAKKKIEQGKKSIRTHRRDLVVVPGLLGMKISVYAGRDFLPFEVTIETLGHKFGEFSPTRQRVKHTSKDKKVVKK
ncbi:MAG: ribosomal protein S19 family protein [Nanoarchaeota archaeon]|nr:ribosomal protein S19 family protein [Nanoarchaeota archaeon]